MLEKAENKEKKKRNQKKFPQIRENTMKQLKHVELNGLYAPI